MVVVALLLAFGVRTYVAQMFYIPSGSMLPTLHVGDRIVVDKLSYRLHGIRRGDVVVFRRPPLEQAAYSDLVKRVIGLPGDTVASVGGRVYIDGKPLDETWLPHAGAGDLAEPLPQPFSLNHPFTVPAGEYFVMGDNRTDSEDSRYFGPIGGDPGGGQDGLRRLAARRLGMADGPGGGGRRAGRRHGAGGAAWPVGHRRPPAGAVAGPPGARDPLSRPAPRLVAHARGHRPPVHCWA